jgi:hypothetical protein
MASATTLPVKEMLSLDVLACSQYLTVDLRVHAKS